MAALTRPEATTNAEAVDEEAVDEEDVRLLRLLARGLPMRAVARRLDMSDRTVRRRTRAICDRLGVSTVIEAVVWAAHHGLLRTASGARQAMPRQPGVTTTDRRVGR